MKRFRFPLRPVAILRAHRELRAKEAFAAAMQALIAAEQRLNAARERVARLGAALAEARTQAFTPAEATVTFRAYRAESLVEANAARATTEARTLMEQRRQEYLTANRELEIVKRLEVKARAAHRAEGLREEQIVLDDFAGFRAARRSSSP